MFPGRASIRTRLGAVFLGFLLLVAGSVGATLVSIRAQAADALVINLAGRQRMLAQQMAKAALGLALPGEVRQGASPSDADQDQARRYRAELQNGATLFDLTLRALLQGGSVPYGGQSVILPAATDAAVRAQLEVVARLWDQLQAAVESVGAEAPGSHDFLQAVDDVGRLAVIVVSEMDHAVRLSEAAAVHKLERLRLIQAAFCFCAVGLLGAGYLLTQRTIVYPLSALSRAACQIASGNLDSSIAVTPAANREILALSRSFEEMRDELALARQRQERWAAELEAQVKQRTEQLAALFELSTEISSELAIDKVLQMVVDKTRRLAGGDVAVLCLLDPPTQLVTVAATSGNSEAFVSPPELLTQSSPEFTVDAMQEAIGHEGAHCPILCPGFLRSHLAVPLRVGSRVVGGLCVGHRQESRFGEEQVRLLTLLADAGAIALENARAYERAEQEARLVERERILADIHDGLAQTLSFLALRLDSVQNMIERQDMSQVPEHLALTQHTIVQAESEMRRLMSSLQAGEEGRLSLQAQLQQAVEQLAAERGLDVELRLEFDPPIHDPPEVCEQVRRIVLEALINASKHAPRSQVEVTLERQDGQALVCVRDDGQGFRPRAALREHGRFGLKVMQARAERIGGVLDIQSSPGRGTAVTLSWRVQT